VTSSTAKEDSVLPQACGAKDPFEHHCGLNDLVRTALFLSRDQLSLGPAGSKELLPILLMMITARFLAIRPSILREAVTGISPTAHREAETAKAHRG